MQLVDMRCRPPTAEILDIQENAFKGICDLMGTRTDAYPIEEWRQEMLDANVVLGACAGRDLESTFGHVVPNDHIAEVVALYPDSLIGYAGIEPQKGRRAVAEVVRCVEEHGFKGVLMDPYMHGIPADDRAYYPIYEVCQEYDLDVVLTTGPGGRIPRSVIADASPARLDTIARDFPDLTLIASHGGWPWVLEMIAVAFRWENVYFEFSVYENFPGAQHYIDGANGIVKDKVLFASAGPFTRVQDAVARYETLAFSDEARQAVMHDNAWRLLTRERRKGQTWTPPSAVAS